MTDAGVISGVSVSHVRASVAEIESAAGPDERTVVERLLAREGVMEAFALQTCNRAEAYVVTGDAADGRRALADFAPEVRDGAVVHLEHEGSIRHLMRVAAGLESLVVGEDQILGQFRTAIAEARRAGGVGSMLDDALTKALHVGERARSETGINEGTVSLGSAAVDLAAESLPVGRSTALVVGAGEMGTLAARALANAGVERLIVANRTVPHAEHVADEVDADATAVALDAVDAAAAEADLVVAATSSPEYVLDGEALVAAGRTLLIDVARPRDIAPDASALDGVTVRDIDALESVTEETRERRREAAATVESLIDEEFDRLLESYKRGRADEAISAMYEGAERVKARELETALSKLEAQGDLTDDQRETVAALADALVGQLLAAPTKSLRDAAAEDDWTTIQTAMRLFDPKSEYTAEDGGDTSAPPRATTPDGLPSDVPEDADIPQHVIEQLSDD